MKEQLLNRDENMGDKRSNFFFFRHVYKKLSAAVEFEDIVIIDIKQLNK